MVNSEKKAYQKRGTGKGEWETDHVNPFSVPPYPFPLAPSPFLSWFHVHVQELLNQGVARLATGAGVAGSRDLVDRGETFGRNLVFNPAFRNTKAGADQCFVAFPMISD